MIEDSNSFCCSFYDQKVFEAHQSSQPVEEAAQEDEEMSAFEEQPSEETLKKIEEQKTKEKQQ